jgi:uncharacterized protein (DUF1778 family)
MVLYGITPYVREAVMSTKSRTSNERLDFRLSAEHKEIIERAAAYAGESLTGYAISTLLDRSREIIGMHESVVLTARDRDVFLDLLDSPPAPSEVLKDAAARYRDLVQSSE